MRISDWSSDVFSSDLPPLLTLCVFLVIRISHLLVLSSSDILQQDAMAASLHIGLVNELMRLFIDLGVELRSEEHTSELQSLMRISYAVFCLKKKNTHKITKLIDNLQYHNTSHS